MPDDTYLLIAAVIDVLTLIINTGLVVTAAVGMFYAWKQLKYLGEQIREARLSSSMSGSLTLYNRYNELGPLREAAAEVFSDEWYLQSHQDQAEVIGSHRVTIDDNERPLKHACIDIANFYEMVGALVATGALPYQVARAFFGGSTIEWWQRLQAWVQVYRETDDPLAFTNFEKIAVRFEKNSRAEAG